MKGQTRLIVEVLVTTGAAGLLSLCLFAGASLDSLPNIFSSVAMELTAVFRDASTQWMALVCVGIYFICFLILRQRWGNEFFHRSNLFAWVALLLVIAIGHFFFYYESSVRSTQAIVLFGAATLGSGAFVWREWGSEKSVSVMVKVIWIFMIFLVAGILINAESFLDFQYRGKQRETGLWDNPNTFGMLMGVGIALAVGAVIQGSRFKVQSSGKESEPRIQNSGVIRWVKIIFFVAAAGVMLFGLVKSYSRGAWVGAAIGISFLIYQFVGCSFEPVARRVGGIFEAQPRRYTKFVSLALILVSIGVLAVWNFRHTHHSTARRAFSVANANDFSWRKRVAAYEGSFQMIADKPWFGFGWNQPEPIYDRFYRAPKVDEGMAIQMNDYFTLGTTLGIPALGCFVAYIYLSLRGGMKHRTSNIEHPTSKGNAECGMGKEKENSGIRRRDSGEGKEDSVFCILYSEYWLQIICRAGAIVLLVGFFFDGGLFKLATGATFWILLELGSEREVQYPKSKAQSDNRLRTQTA